MERFSSSLVFAGGENTAAAPTSGRSATAGDGVGVGGTGKTKQGKYEATIFTPIEYDPELHGVGVGSIDAQHRTLIGVIDKLCQLGKRLNDPPVSSAAAAGGSTPTPAAKNAPGFGPKTKSTQQAAKELAAATPSSPGGVMPPMSMAGAMMMDMKKFQSGSDSDSSDSDDEKRNKKAAAATSSNKKDEDRDEMEKTVGRGLHLREPALQRRRSTVAGSADDDALSKSIHSHNHVYPARVGPSDCARFIDRGMPPTLQAGGEFEPLLEALIFHANVKLIQEEHNLEAVSFSDRGPHAQEHQLFVREIFKASTMVEASNFELSDLVRLIKFLKAWISSHLPKDRRAAPLMLEKAAKG